MTTSARSSGSGPAVAKHAARLLGGTARVTQFFDDDEANETAVLSCDGVPGAGWVTCSTVELHQTRNVLNGRDIRVELMMSARSQDEAIANVVATSAFYVMKDGWLAAPGVVFPGLVSECFPSSTTPSIMWMEPFSAPELSTTEVDGVGTVHWLLGVPLTEAEHQLLLAEGYDVLEERLGSAGAEFFDLWRASVV